MARRTINVVCAASLPVYIVAYSLFMVSFTFSNWVKHPSDIPAEEYTYGLWWNCSSEVNEDSVLEHDCRSYIISELDDSWIACQAFYIVALVLGFVVCTIYPKIPVNSTFQIISGVSILLTTIIFATSTSLSEEEQLDWAFALGPVCGVLLLGNGLLLAFHMKKVGCSMDDVMPPERKRKDDKP